MRLNTEIQRTNTVRNLKVHVLPVRWIHRCSSQDTETLIRSAVCLFATHKPHFRSASREADRSFPALAESVWNNSGGERDVSRVITADWSWAGVRTRGHSVDTVLHKIAFQTCDKDQRVYSWITSSVDGEMKHSTSGRSCKEGGGSVTEGTVGRWILRQVQFRIDESNLHSSSTAPSERKPSSFEQPASRRTGLC